MSSDLTVPQAALTPRPTSRRARRWESARPRTGFALAAAGVLLVGGCTRHEPPAPATNASAPADDPATRSPASPGDAALRPHHDDAEVAAPEAPPASTNAGTALLDAASDGMDAGALPQTHDRPAGEGAAFDVRVHAFWDGLVTDDPERALDFFFPVAAYAQVKAVSDPQRDWRRRLVANYERDVHALHAGLGPDPQFVALEVPDARAKWIEPGEEYNKLGYFRVYGTVLRWTVRGPGGTRRARSANVSSLISWRGDWYVVHLTGFK